MSGDLGWSCRGNHTLPPPSPRQSAHVTARHLEPLWAFLPGELLNGVIFDSSVTHHQKPSSLFTLKNWQQFLRAFLCSCYSVSCLSGIKHKNRALYRFRNPVVFVENVMETLRTYHTVVSQLSRGKQIKQRQTSERQWSDSHRIGSDIRGCMTERQPKKYIKQHISHPQVETCWWSSQCQAAWCRLIWQDAALHEQSCRNTADLEAVWDSAMSKSAGWRSVFFRYVVTIFSKSKSNSHPEIVSVWYRSRNRHRAKYLQQQLKPFNNVGVVLFLIFTGIFMLVVWFLWLCFYCLCIISWPPRICLRLALCLNTKMKCEGFILICLFIYKMSKIRKRKMGKWTVSHQLTKTGQEKMRKTVHSLHCSRSQCSRAPLGCGWSGRLDKQLTNRQAWCCHVNAEHNLREMFAH